MKTYTIIGGVNGSGKSSLTGALKSERADLGMIVDVDKIASSGVGIINAGIEAIRRINEYIKNGISFTQETTLSGLKTEKNIRAARENDFWIRLYYVGVGSAEESIYRIKNRVSKGGHNIASEDVLRRFATRKEDLWRILPLCDEAVFFDNENGFSEVAIYRNGEIVLTSSNPPEWLKELI